MKRRVLVGIAFVCSAIAYAADITPILEKTATYEYGKDPSAVRELESAVLKAAGTPEAANLEKQVIAGFQSAKTLAGKDALCRALAVIGTDASVPALSGMLANAETTEMARYALEAIPGQASVKALHSALSAVPPEAKAGVVVSLGHRKDKSSVGVLKPLLASPDRQLADAAATALGEIGDNAARDALINAKPSPAIADALLMIAERSTGSASSGIYKKLAAAGYPDSVRVAALSGLARVDTKGSVPLLTAALKGDSPSLRAASIQELATIEGVGLAASLSEFPPRAQIQIIDALVRSGKGDVLPVLEKSLASDNESVRVASLQGIGKLGTAKQVPLLAGRAASSTGDEQAAARAALGLIRGKDADEAVLSSIAAADPKTKVELIRASGERGIQTAPPILLQTAGDANRAVRLESIRALRETAGPAQAPALTSLLIQTKDENDRKELERAVAAAIRRSKDAPITELANGYKASTDPAVQASLLSVMSAVGNSQALPVVREALKSSNADVQRAALNSLAAWPSADPLPDLLTLAQSAPNAAHQVLALRGYVRLVQIPSSRPPSETAKLLSAGLAAAKRPEEKKIVIAAAQRVITPESVDLVKSLVNDPAVGAEAKAAMTVLERGLMYRRN